MVNMNTRRHKHDWEVFDSWRYGENASYKQIRDRALEKYGDISLWDTSKITNMSHLFENYLSFNNFNYF